MKEIRILAIAAALMLATAMIGSTRAEEPTQPNPSNGWMGNWMMGNWTTGSHGMMGYYGMGPGMMGWGGSGPAMCDAMAGHIEGRLAYLKTELKITDAQEPLWKSYAAAAGFSC